MRIVTVSHRSGDLLPILLDGDGLPIPSPNEFLLSRRNLSTNTLIRNLRELSVFYRWLEDRQIDLRARLKTGTLFTEAEFSGGLIEFLRKDMETDVECAGQKHHYGTKKLPAKKNHASGEGSHQTIPLKRADALDSAALFTGGVVHSGYRGACRTQK